jgi:hypothetical protein
MSKSHYRGGTTSNVIKCNIRMVMIVFEIVGMPDCSISNLTKPGLIDTHTANPHLTP